MSGGEEHELEKGEWLTRGGMWVLGLGTTWAWGWWWAGWALALLTPFIHFYHVLQFPCARIGGSILITTYCTRRTPPFW